MTGLPSNNPNLPNTSLGSTLLEATNGIANLLRFPASRANGETAKVLWLIRLRWMAIAMAFALAGPALHAGFLGRQSIPSYLGLIGLLFVFNVYMSIARSNIDAVAPLETCFHLAFDFVMLTGLLLLTGGFSNPFVALFFMHVSLGGVLITGRLDWPFLYLAHLLLAVTQISLWSHQPDEQLLTTFAVYHVMLLAFWLVMRSLGGELSRQAATQSQARLALEKQDRLRAIGSLAAGFSHEFASPLNAAKIRLERMARLGDGEDLRETRASLLACEAIIHRMNSAQLDLSTSLQKHLQLDELLNDVVESWREENPTSRLRVENGRKISTTIPPINFAQVILNLLDNAFEAAPENEILLRLEAHTDRLVLTVEDQGAGVPPSVLARFGEPFITTKPQGTGLGLYVSTLFAQSLGGELKVEARRPVGTRLRLEWPNGERK